MAYKVLSGLLCSFSILNLSCVSCTFFSFDFEGILQDEVAAAEFKSFSGADLSQQQSKVIRLSNVIEVTFTMPKMKAFLNVHAHLSENKTR